ncbi:MAG: hypothetical protein CEN88_332 [Candidatus Berkelbacteria bacterium Licking1014_2]|uniref:Nucleotidyl transferase AbiEii/AbiGii toxin family protein n=1 Tax=Candidatus Berkelbacteria bacterium Licking1014_2 TaxID=2017146 RepID=A0A554LUG8_9BACT|nr:MAG: hypothetical protein CEN88_332 [Candidatus Berkelbacteria bacterium Licking1014_2]
MKEFSLTKLQKIILSTMAESELKDDFYWTGGTALAYFYLQHRRSLDIDLFSEKPFSYETITPIVKTISQKTKLKKIQEKRIFDRWEFFLSDGEEIRLEFVHYDFPTLNQKREWQGIWVDSATDMAANKTMALIDRHDPKDAFDIYFLLTKLKYSPQKLLKLARQKFGGDFPPSLFWSNCLTGANQLQTIQPLMLEQNPQKLVRKIAAYFEKQAAESLRSIL